MIFTSILDFLDRDCKVKYSYLLERKTILFCKKGVKITKLLLTNKHECEYPIVVFIDWKVIIMVLQQTGGWSYVSQVRAFSESHRRVCTLRILIQSTDIHEFSLIKGWKHGIAMCASI